MIIDISHMNFLDKYRLKNKLQNDNIKFEQIKDGTVTMKLVIKNMADAITVKLKYL